MSESNPTSPTITFPLGAILPNGKQYTIDKMTDTETAEMFRMIESAAEKGDGFGMNEYGGWGEFQRAVKDADKFVFKEKCTNKPAAYLCIIPCVYCRCRSIRDVVLVVTEAERNKRISHFVGTFGVDYCLRRGYDGILTDTFTINSAAIKSLKRLGFKRIGHLEIGGRVKGHGYVGSYFFFLDLRGKDRSQRLPLRKDGLYAPLSVNSKL